MLERTKRARCLGFEPLLEGTWMGRVFELGSVEDVLEVDFVCRVCWVSSGGQGLGFRV